MTPYDPEKHGPKRIVGPGFHQRVHDVVRTVPPGFVSTFGDVAAQLGSKNVARHVGYALAAIEDGMDVPWWRVIQSKGTLPRAGTGSCAEQEARLQAEGVEVVEGRVVGFAQRRYEFGLRSSRDA